MSDRKRYSLLLLACAFFINMLGTTLPTPLYPIYEQQFHLKSLVITLIFATYAIGVISGLLLLGHQSDRVGRRVMLFVALGFSGLSAITFLFAYGPLLLYLGRLLSGLSAGIFSGTGTAAMVDLASDDRRKQLAELAVASNFGGLATGQLLSGILAQYFLAPLRLAYAVDLALVVAAGLCIAWVVETVQAEGRGFSLKLQSLRLPQEIRTVFVRAAIVGTSSFAVSGLFGAVAPSLFATQMHAPNHALAGALNFVLIGCSAIAQVSVDRIPNALVAGCIGLVTGLGLLAGAVQLASPSLTFAASVLCGAGQGLTIGFGLSQINEKVEAQRSQVSSTYFVLLYTGLTIPVIGVGFVGQAIGLPKASLIFCAIVGLAVLSVLMMLLKPGRSVALGRQRHP